MVKPPKTAQIIGGCTSSSSLPDPATLAALPAHIKQLPARIDHGKLLSLPVGSPAAVEAAAKAWMNYLIRPDLYAEYLPAISARDVPVAYVSPHHAIQLIEAGLVEPVPFDSVKGSIAVFKVLELHKNRWRIIQDTKAHNALMPDAPSVSFTGLNRRRQHVHLGSHAVDRDFMAYYHQFPLDPAVRDYFCTRLPMPDGSNKLFRLCVGATGQKHMVHTAVATTDLLLDFDRQSAATDTQIDNVLFIGSPDDVLADLRTFVARCDAAQVTINDATPDLASLVKTRVEWCGMVLDFAEKRVSITEKSISKLQLSWSNRNAWTWQGFAAHMGLLWWSMQVLKNPVARYFNLLRFVSNTSKCMQAADDKNWHLKAEIPPSVWLDLQAWTDIALANAPVRVVPRKPAEVYVLVDASAHGWGFVAYDTVTGKTFQYGAPWPESFAAAHAAQLGKSTFTEPWAVLFTKSYLTAVLGRPAPSFLIGSDNAPTVYVFTKRFSSRSFNMNNAVRLDDELFSHCPSEYVHVPGKRNVLADAKSRGLLLNDSAVFGDTDIIDSLRRLLGDFPAELRTSIPKGAGKDEANGLPLSLHHTLSEKNNNNRNNEYTIE